MLWLMTYSNRFIIIILILNNALGWSSTFTSIVTCPARQEAVKPLNCLFAGLSRERKSRGHAPSPRGRNRRMSTGTPPPAAARIRIYFCYFTLSIDGEALDLGARKCLRTATNNPWRLRTCTTTIPWPHSRVTSRACVPFCRWGLKFPSNPQPLQRDCSFHRDASVVLHFGDHTSIFVLYKGSNVLLFFYPICVFS